MLLNTSQKFNVTSRLEIERHETLKSYVVLNVLCNRRLVGFGHIEAEEKFPFFTHIQKLTKIVLFCGTFQESTI